MLIGLASIIETMGCWFDIVRIAGAAYLVWLGWKPFSESRMKLISRCPEHS